MIPAGGSHASDLGMPLTLATPVIEASAQGTIDGGGSDPHADFDAYDPA